MSCDVSFGAHVNGPFRGVPQNQTNTATETLEGFVYHFFSDPNEHEKLSFLQLIDPVKEQLEQFKYQILWFVASNPDPQLTYFWKWFNRCLLVFDASEKHIVGYVIGVGRSYYQSVEYVELNKEYRGQKLCQPLVELFIDLMNSKGTFTLLNEGGAPACKCYAKAFENKNFLAYDGHDRRIQECGAHGMSGHMHFKYTPGIRDLQAQV